ncbi:MAG: DUF1736 domain-containing protein [Planctomycetes bacterium]|nr:DUF1736 domain-containing protein [Planctomycetota bacterium]
MPPKKPLARPPVRKPVAATRPIESPFAPAPATAVGPAAPFSLGEFLLGTWSRPSMFVVALLLGVLSFSTYANSFDCGLVLDNFLIVGADKRLKSPAEENVDLVFSKGYWWPTWESNLWRPMTTFSYLVNYSLWGNGRTPAGYHVVNLALHWVVTLLTYGLILAMIRKPWISIGAAAIFAVHPLNTESVTNIVGRADLLVALVIVAGIHLHRLSYTASWPLAILTRVMLVVLAGVGQLSKESAVVLGLTMWFYDLATYDIRPRETFRDVVHRYPVRFLLSVLVCFLLTMSIVIWAGVRFGLFDVVKYVVLPGAMIIALPLGCLLINGKITKQSPVAALARRFIVSGVWSYLAVVVPATVVLEARFQHLKDSPVFDEIGADNPIVAAWAFVSPETPEAMRHFVGGLTGRMTAIKVIGLYAKLFCWPSTLSCDYSYDEIRLFGWTLSDPGDLATWLTLLVIVGSSLWLFFAPAAPAWFNRPLYFFGWLFWIAFGPTSNLLRGVGSIMGERFMYLPLVGAVGVCAVLAVVGIERLAAKRPEWMPLLPKVLGPTLAVVVIGFGVRSYERNIDWLNELNLWTSAVKACPDSFKVYKGLAGAITGQDLTPEQDRDPEFRAARIHRLVEPLKAGYSLHPASVRQALDERLEKIVSAADQKRDENMDEAAFRDKWLADMNAETYDLSAWVAEQGTNILESKPLPLWHMPNGIFQDVARYYLLLGDQLARMTDPKMQTFSPEAYDKYTRAVASLERAREMDRAVNEKSREDRAKRGMPDDKIIDVGNFRIYQNLGVLYMRLSAVNDRHVRDARLEDAATALKYMQALEPTSPDSYYNLAMVKISQNQASPAIVYLFEVLILKPDSKEAWGALEQLSPQLVPGENVLVLNPGNNQPALNTNTPFVRKHMNQALHNLCETMLRARRPSHADEVFKLGVTNYACPPEVFSDLVARFRWTPPRVAPDGVPGMANPQQPVLGGLR